MKFSVATQNVLLNTLVISASAFTIGPSSIWARDEFDVAPSCPLSDNSTVSDFYNQPEVDTTLCTRTVSKRGTCLSVPLESTDGVRVATFTRERAASVWAFAARVGPGVAKALNKFASAGKNRLTGNSLRDDQAKFEQNYRKKDPSQPGEGHWLHHSWDLVTYWPQVNGPDLDADKPGWKVIDYFSKKKKVNTPDRNQLSIIGLAGQDEKGILVIHRAFGNCDGTDEEGRVYASNLVWNGWKAIAGGPEKARDLKYIVFMDVFNELTNAVATVAHELFPGNVDNKGSLPDDPNNRGPTAFDHDSVDYPAYTGHGTWRPEDRAWQLMLATPLLKMAANMLMDYNAEMNNNWPAVMHTFPAVHRSLGGDGMPRLSYRRPGYIVVELEPYHAGGIVEAS